MGLMEAITREREIAGESEPLLQIKGLSVTFETKRKIVAAVEDVSLSLTRGDVLGLVGESGSGKTMTALSILQLLPLTAKMRGDIYYSYYHEKKTKQQQGIIREEYGGGSGELGETRRMMTNLARMSDSELRPIRGGEIAVVFQDPLSALNPVHRVGDQIVEAIRLHSRMQKKAAWKRAIELMSQVGIQSPEKRARDYPHQLSGGMRQRVMIAMALSCNPKLLIADEPTTMLDEMSQMQTIDLLKRIKGVFGAILYITHDLGVVAELCNRVAVMYAGRIVEIGDVVSIFKNPKHPYTKMLLDSIPRVDRAKQRLSSIPGMITSNVNPTPQCRFVDRCPYAVAKCRAELPDLEDTGDPQGHMSACIRWNELYPRRKDGANQCRQP